MNNYETLFAFLGAILAGIAFVLLYTWLTYNNLIKKYYQVKTDFADIDIYLKRRSSLIDNLVELVKGYAKHEKETFENVSKARSMVDTSKSVKDMAKADNELTSTLRSLFMVAENYPKLEASNNFKKLQEELTNTEDMIAIKREEYNSSVQRYNTQINVFPHVMIASLMKFFEEPLFINQER